MTTTQHVSSPTRTIAAPHRSVPILGLCLVVAALLVVSGIIHLHLWQGPYRHIPQSGIDTAFIVQWVLCFVGAAAVLALRNVLAVVAGGLLMAGTVIGYFISRYTNGGILGFHLPYTTTDANYAMVVEIVGTVLALGTAVAMLRRREA